MKWNLLLKITNLSDKKMTGKAQVKFLDAVTMTPIAHDKNSEN